MDHAGVSHQQPQNTHTDAFRRSAVACNRCRSRKTKCTGLPPSACKACQDTGNSCIYTDPEKRVNVTESYLRELQAQANALAPQTANRPRADNQGASHSPDVRPATVPLAEEEWGRTGLNNWVVGQSGQHHYVGHSSSTYIANRLNPTTETLAWHLYPHYQDTRWLRRPPAHVPDLPELPPYDMARRMYKAQYQYIGTIFSFLREQDFHQRLDRLYAGPPDLESQESCLIHCQMLLVLAFGQHYSVNQWISHDGPPGFAYFKAALQFLPAAHEEPCMLFVQVLGYVAYYMQTLNRRDTAYLHVGLALRMAISLGLHQEVSSDDFDEAAREHRRRVWWSVYSMERLLTVTSGHPSSIRDADIHLRYPQSVDGEDPGTAAILRSYTQLSQIQGIIKEKVYRAKQHSKTDLSASVQGIMQKLSDWLAQLPTSVRLDFDNLDSCMTRERASVYLHYYHCINIAARPLLLFAVQRQLDVIAYPTGRRVSQAESWDAGLSSEVVCIIEDAIAAARMSALLLHNAAKHNILATFGFLDGEQAFSTALLLVMVNIAFSYNEQNTTCMHMAMQALQGMAEKGNRYIRACHSLLRRMMENKKIAQRPVGLGNTIGLSGDGTNEPSLEQLLPQQREQEQARRVQIQQEQEQEQEATNARPSQSFAASSATPMDGAQLDMGPLAPDLVLEGDSAIWAEVLDSLGINMDVHWIETAFLTDKGPT